MNTKYVLIASALLLATNAFSQTKLDLGLNHLLSQHKVMQARQRIMGKSANSDDIRINVLVQLQSGATMPTKELQGLGITVGTHCGSFASMLVPMSSLKALSELDAIKAVEQGKRLVLQNKISQQADSASFVNNAENAATVGLPKCYTGKGVIAAIVDCGIDFNHVNFRDPITHKTRIKQATVYRNYNVDYFGNVTDLYGNPIQYSDVRESYTDEADIDTLTSDSYGESHGTHTSSTIAGSFRGDYIDKYGHVNYTANQGVAPETDLLLAGIGEASMDFPVLDALSVFKTKAEELNEPMVVSISFGANGDWLDGKNIFNQFYDEYTDCGNKPGVIVCQSAGNEGDDMFTIHKNLDESNEHTVSVDIARGECPSIRIYSSDSTPFDVSIDCYKLDTNTWDYKYDKTISSDMLKEYGFLTCDTYSNHDGRFAAMLMCSPDETLLNYSVYVPILVIKSQKDCNIRLIATSYSHSDGTYTPFDMQGTTDFKSVTAGDATSSLNYEACTNSVLSVGAWQANNAYVNYGGSETTSVESDNGKIAAFSSYVVADDNGISRPDCLTPGVNVISGFNSYDTNQWGNKIGNKVCGKASEEYLEGHTSIIGRMSGTSMACPNAAGIIALWLQANPRLTVNQVRQIIRETADNDEYTQKDPSRSGAGKINALAGLKYILQNYPTAIHEVIDGNPKGLEEPAACKTLINNRLCIKKGNQLYDIQGRAFEQL